MTISSQNYIAQTTGDGTTTVFPIPFYFTDNAFVLVTRLTISTGAIETLTSGFTITGAGNPSGGTCTFASPPTSNQIITRELNIPLLQESDFTDNGPFPANDTEKALDKLTQITQQLKRITDRCFKNPTGESTAVVTQSPALATRANKLAAWDSSGNLTALATNDAGVNTVTASGTTTARTLSVHLGDYPNVKNFGAIGNGVADDTIAVQNALNTVSAAGGGTVFMPAGTYLLNDVSIPSNTRLVGAGRGVTKLRAVGANRILNHTGTLGISGPVVINAVIEHLSIVGSTNATEGMRVTSAAVFKTDSVDFSGCTGAQLYLDQVWDTVFKFTNFKNGNSTTTHALVINYGSDDNSNNLRFDACTFETLKYGAIKIICGSTSTNSAYNIALNNGCKFENVVDAAVAAASVGFPIEITATNAAPALNISFNGGWLATAHGTKENIGVTAGQIENLYLNNLDVVHLHASLTTALVNIGAGVIVKGLYLNHTRIQGAGAVATYYAVKVTGAGALTRVGGYNNLYNGSSFSLTEIAGSANGHNFQSSIVIRDVLRSATLEQQRYNGSGSQVGAGSWQVNSSGEYECYNGTTRAFRITTNGTIVFDQKIVEPSFTVATLPASTLGSRCFVSDATQTMTAGIGAIVAGGGANKVPVFSDGTNWRIG